MNANKNIAEQAALQRYHQVLRDVIQVQFPSLSIQTIDECIKM